jgi:hypothetical protein
MTGQGPEGLYRAGRYEKSSLALGAEEEGGAHTMTGDGEGTHAHYDINLATRLNSNTMTREPYTTELKNHAAKYETLQHRRTDRGATLEGRQRRLVEHTKPARQCIEPNGRYRLTTEGTCLQYIFKRWLSFG